jgi:hypothetical protein
MNVERNVMSKKNSSEKIELVETNETFAKAETTKGDTEKLDYSGAHAKTSPAEIKLVRKLDLWIMVSCPILVWELAWLLTIS